MSRLEFGIPDGVYEDYRVAEAILRMREIKLYNTPNGEVADWVQRGWDLYDALRELGYRLIDEPGTTMTRCDSKAVIEIHPHASFVVGLGWIPQTKGNLAGQFERLAYLRHECEQLRIDCTDTIISADALQVLRQLDVTWEHIRINGIKLPRISHDSLDAVVGVTTVLRAVRGEAYAVGHKADGVIVVPRPLAPDPYQPKEAG